MLTVVLLKVVVVIVVTVSSYLSILACKLLMEHIQEKEPPSVITSDTENATQIHPEDASPDKQYKFRKFRAYNTDMWNGPKRENTEEFRRQDNLHRYDSIASSLSLTDRQKSVGRKKIEDIRFQDIANQKVKFDHLVFALCVIIANRDVRDGSRYYPHPEAAGDDDFVEMGETLGMDRADQISAVEKVRSRIDS